ncbi:MULTISPECIES: hypothetical protein [unclassified Paenibacillus]|uniref:hypothetical protein n=1 Tax=unclassified Paenibacillus TaxID=185978 RepID=UPI0008990FE8|nr:MULTISPECIES: hypothetical protein [unclassified Paenibacillus]SEB12214.1 hypothetical protein SAMN03159332_3687 [Paenibacillus sp. 276b]
MTDLNAYHYFEKRVGPFRNLSSLSEQDAEAVAQHIRQGGRNFASQRSADYMMIRRELERKAYEQFISKGGKPTNRYPHYMTLGACAWLESWYTEPDWVTISWEDLPASGMESTG